MKSKERNVQTIGGVPQEFIEKIFNRLMERCVDGIVVVGPGFFIQLANSHMAGIVEESNREGVIGSNYFQKILGCKMSSLNSIQLDKVPMYRAIMTGKVDDEYRPTIATANGIVAQVETRVAYFQHDGGDPVLVALELWRPHGDVEVFEHDEDFVDLRQC